MKIEVTMTLEKLTKGAVRYAEDAQAGAEPKIGTIYVRKAALGGKEPANVRVTVEST